MKKQIFCLTLALSTLLFGCGMAFTLAGMPPSDSGAADVYPAAGNDIPVDVPAEPEPPVASAPAEDSSVLKTEQLENCTAVSLRTGGSGQTEKIRIMDSKESLDAYYEANRISCSLDKRCGTLSFEEAMRPYSSSFFNENVLLILQLSEEDVSTIPVVSGLGSDGSIYIERTTDSTVTAGSRQWHILISVPAEHSALNNGSFRIIEY